MTTPNGHLEEEEHLLDDSRNGDGGEREGRHGQLTPSQAQMLIARMGQQGGEPFNVEREFLTTSRLPEEFLARTDITEVELSWLNRTTLEMNWANVLFTDEEHSMWVFFGARPSVGGESRRQALEAHTAHKRQMEEERRSFMDRLTRMDTRVGQGQNGQR
jgi:hypothetical protein